MSATSRVSQDDSMGRVVVIGNGGGGKSTLAKRLAERHNLPWLSVDQMQWGPGWNLVSDAEVIDRLRVAMSADRWIIDGWGPWSSIEERLSQSDTIIFVDLPLWMHFWLAAERQISIARGGSRSDPVDGCDDLTATRRLFETIWYVDRELKPRLTHLIERHAQGREYHHVTTLDQLDRIAAD